MHGKFLKINNYVLTVRMCLISALVILFTILITNIRRDYWPIIFLVRSSSTFLVPEFIYQDHYDYVELSNKDVFENDDALWTECSSTCGGGLQKMRKWKVTNSSNGGSQENNLPHPIRTCNENPCGKKFRVVLDFSTMKNTKSSTF